MTVIVFYAANDSFQSLLNALPSRERAVAVLPPPTSPTTIIPSAVAFP